MEELGTEFPPIEERKYRTRCWRVKVGSMSEVFCQHPGRRVHPGMCTVPLGQKKKKQKREGRREEGESWSNRASNLRPSRMGSPLRIVLWLRTDWRTSPSSIFFSFSFSLSFAILVFPPSLLLHLLWPLSLYPI